MLAPRYIPTDLQLTNFEHDLEKHHKKLNEIQKVDRKKKTGDKDAILRAKIFEERERTLKFHNSEKALAIEKDNEILLGRLVEISRKKKPSLFPLSQSYHPKSLNGPSRQREKDRIALENEAFAKRLLSQQPLFDRKKLDRDYEVHQQRVKLIMKLDPQSPRKKLPPLKSKKELEEQKRLEEERLRLEQEKKEKEEREQKEKEEKEKKEKEEKERKEKEEKERKEREEKEKKEKEEREKKEKEEKERKEKEEAERKKKEEEEAEKKRKQAELDNMTEAEKKAKAEEDAKWKELDAKDGDNPMLGMMRGITIKQQKEDEKKLEDEKWQQIDKKDGDNPMLGMMRGMTVKTKEDEKKELIAAEKKKAEEEEKKKKEEEEQKKKAEEEKWKKIDKKDGDNPMLGMMRGLTGGAPKAK